MQHSQRDALGSGNGFEGHRQGVSAAGFLVRVSCWVAALEVAALVYLLASIADAPRVAGAVTAAVHITRDGKLPKRERERVVVVLRVVLVALEVGPLRALSRDALHRSTFVRIDLVGRDGWPEDLRCHLHCRRRHRRRLLSLSLSRQHRRVVRAAAAQALVRGPLHDAAILHFTSFTSLSLSFTSFTSRRRAVRSVRSAAAERKLLLIEYQSTSVGRICPAQKLVGR